MTKTYTTVQGDQWDLVAYKVYGSEKYMSTLLEANRQYKDISVFSAGVDLTCPDIDVAAEAFRAPWRR